METVEQQLLILKGKPYQLNGELRYITAFQNRILFPSVLLILTNIKILSVREWYLILRLFTACLSFFVFFNLLIYVAKSNCKLAAVGIGLFAYELILTFNQGWEHPTDFLDAMFISLFLWMASQRRRLLLFLFAILASTNRESSAFAGVIWFFLYGITKGLKLRLKETLYAVLLSISSYAFIIIIRYTLGGENVESQQMIIGWTGLIRNIKRFLERPTPSSWPILFLAMFLPLFLWIYSNRNFLLSTHIRLLISSFAICCISLVFGSISELRILIPSIVIMVFVAVAAEANVENSRSLKNGFQAS